jgi:protease-4
VSDGTTRAGRALIVLVAAGVAGVVGWLLFVVFPGNLAKLLGVLLVIGVVLSGARLGSRIASQRFPEYNVAEIAVEGPISRDGGPGRLPTRPGGAGADDVVDLIEAADEDDHAKALLVKLDTPGGAVVPSDDIRLAAAAFDGPTVAYTTDVCASGGYWIASGCDELWARDASIVGSIGVIGSRPNVSELADQLGVSYERFAAGKYKDAGQPLKEMSDDERAYLQRIVDDYYDNFVDRVAEGRDMDPAAIRETEARVYLGEEALDLGLVDHLGTRDDVEQRVEALIDEEVSVSTFEPQQGLAARLRGGAQTVAFALGAGIASAVSPEDGFDFRM